MSEAEAHEHKPTSTRIAMAMAVVAMLGAVAAFRTALAEQDTSRFEHRFDQGKMLGLALRQDLLDTSSIGARFRSSYDLRIAEAENALKESRTLLPNERAKAAALNLKAQEEFAVARSLVPFLRFASPIPENSLEDSIALFPGVRIHFAPVQHGFGRSVITMIAVTAMLSACAGYLYSRAATTSGHAAAVALEQQENGFKTGSLQRDKLPQTGKACSGSGVSGPDAGGSPAVRTDSEQPYSIKPRGCKSTDGAVAASPRWD